LEDEDEANQADKLSLDSETKDMVASEVGAPVKE
jgi:DNA-directed RNA polymerase subunit beta